jgi:hypothetical protein
VRRGEVIVAVALVAAGVVSIGVLIPRFVAETPVGGGLSPAFMPYVAAALATLAALAMLVGTMRAPGAQTEPARAGRAELRFLGGAAAVLGASYALMSFAGYVIGGMVLVAGLLKLARVAPLPLAIVAVAAPAALWLLFVGLLAMPLP